MAECDLLRENAEAFARICEDAQPPDARGAVDEVADLSALHRGSGLTARRDDAAVPAAPSVVIVGGDAREDGKRQLR